MVKAFRHPVSGAVTVCNAGAHTGVYYNVGDVISNPDSPPPVFTTAPAFITPVNDTVGEAVYVNPGVASPIGTVIAVEIGTGTDSSFVQRAEEGTSANLIDAMIGLVITARVTATFKGKTAVVYISSGTTVVADDPEPEAFPAPLTIDQWTATELREAPYGRRVLRVEDDVAVPSGFRIRGYSGPPPDTSTPYVTLTPGVPYTTGDISIGASIVNRMWWQRIDDLAYGNPSNTTDFTILGPVPGEPPDLEGFPAVNETVSSTSALLSALAARAASGSAATWVIECTPGNYGGLNVANLTLPGRTIIRSSNWPSCGAVFTSINMTFSRNLLFSFVTASRQGQGDNIGLSVVTLDASYNCGIEYSDIDCGPFVTRASRGLSPSAGYVQWVAYGIRCEPIIVGSTRYQQALTRIYGNYVHGPAAALIRINETSDFVCEENVTNGAFSDSIQTGAALYRGRIVNNWLCRVKYLGYVFSSSSGWQVVHPDWMQIDTRFEPGMQDCYIAGNVMMKAAWPVELSTCQGIFTSIGVMRRNTYENNIVLTSSQQGLWDVGPAFSTGAVARKNSILHLYDAPQNPQQPVTSIRLEGSSVTNEQNVQCNFAGTAAPNGGLNIPTSNTSKTSVELYYTRARQDSTFFDLRPVGGAVTAISAGAYERFGAVIFSGAYPKIGPAAAAWQALYNAKNQITS